MMSKHIGSSFDDFLEEEGIKEEVEAAAKNKIKKIDVDHDGNVTFWFYDSDEPWSVEEFEKGSDTRECLECIEDMIYALGDTQ
jgi:hypothetical protein